MLKYSWGKTMPPSQGAGNYADRSAAAILGNIIATYDDSYIVSSPVGKFGVNHKGLADMSGNVAEWIHDFYGIKTGLSLKTEVDPIGPDKGDHHVIRGSSWAHGTVTELRLSFRDYGNDPRNDVGFRIARYVDKQ
jgi:formylglycine-generating enzyme required for sulfatase activity